MDYTHVCEDKILTSIRWMLPWVTHHSKHCMCTLIWFSQYICEIEAFSKDFFSSLKEGGEKEKERRRAEGREGSVYTHTYAAYLCKHTHTHNLDLYILLNHTLEKFQQKRLATWVAALTNTWCNFRWLSLAIHFARVFSPGCHLGIRNIEGLTVRATWGSDLRTYILRRECPGGSWSPCSNI